MSDDYPAEWGFQPDKEEPPTIDGRPITSLQSGLQTEPRETGTDYPSEWRR
jgi:hypothetical protein